VLAEIVTSRGACVVGARWTVITYWPDNATLLWVVLAVPALLAGYTLADALTGSTGLGTASHRRRGGSRR
jgi:hypothetical protein